MIFIKQTIFDKLGMRATSYFREFGESSIARGHGYVLGLATPMPFAPIEQPNAANLLCTTAPDLAKFVAELMTPSILSKNLLNQMLSPREHIGVDLSWGLGIVLYHRGNNRCFRQWGDNVDFESYLLGFPAQKIGGDDQQFWRPIGHQRSCRKSLGWLTGILRLKRSEMHEYRGGCHCQNVEWILRSRFATSELPPRACQCAFCRRHDAVSTSDADGEMRFLVKDSAAIIRYSFATKTAEFFQL